MTQTPDQAPSPPVSKQSVLARAADVLDDQTQAIVERWLERLPDVTPSLPRGLCLRDIENAAPWIIHGVAEALRVGRPEALDAPWTASAREHALLRREQNEDLGDLLREFQVLREEIWAALVEHLRPVPADDVFVLGRSLGAAVDTMATNSSRTYGGELERALREAEAGREATARLAALVEYSEDAIIATDLQGIVEHWNPGAERLYGYSAEEMAGRSVSVVLPSDQRGESARILDQIREGRAVPRHETVRVRKDGARIDVSLSISPIKDGEGRVIGASSRTNDITEQVQLRHERERLLAELQTERTRLQAVLEQMPSGVIIAEAPSGRIQTGNAQVQRIFRHPLLPSKGVEEYGQWQGFHPDGRPYAPEEWPLARSIRWGRVVRDEEVDILRGDGTRGFIRISSAPVRDERGQIVAGVAVYEDITERKRAEDAVRRAKEYAEQLIETANVMIIGLDAAGNVRVFNQAAEEITGYSRSELQGRSWFDVLVPRERYPQVWAVFNRAVSEGAVPRTLENPILTKSGEERYILFRNSVLREDGAITGTISFGIDVTEAREADAERQRLLEAERRARREAEAALRARDEFLGVAAHELKTPVTNLRGYAELALRRIDTGRITRLEEVRPVFATIDRQANRLAILTNQLLDLTALESGELVLHRQETDLVPLVGGLVETMQATSARHTLTLHAPPSLPALVDPERLTLVLYNLIDNAIKYSPLGGPVEVDLSAPGPDTVRIAVRDWGIGVPPEQRARLFTRFYQGAERPAGGLGIGLYIGRQLVALHGGRIWAEFPEDGGSRFVVELPRGRRNGGN